MCFKPFSSNLFTHPKSDINLGLIEFSDYVNIMKIARAKVTSKEIYDFHTSLCRFSFLEHTFFHNKGNTTVECYDNIMPFPCFALKLM